MEPVRYYFDESGEKGFIDSNFSASDIGLIAGVALPARVIGVFEPEVATIPPCVRKSSRLPMVAASTRS